MNHYPLLKYFWILTKNIKGELYIFLDSHKIYTKENIKKSRWFQNYFLKGSIFYFEILLNSHKIYTKENIKKKVDAS